MKQSKEPHGKPESRVLPVIAGSFMGCLMSIGNFFRKDNAELFLPNLLFATVFGVFWAGIIGLWVAELISLWRQARACLTFRTAFAFGGWLFVGAWVVGAAWVSMAGWALRLGMSDDLR